MVGVARIRSVVVFVDDEQRALDFYVGTLGFEPRGEAEWEPGVRCVMVAPAEGEATIALVRPSLSTMGAGRASWAHERVGDPTGIVLETEDVEAAYRDLQARGVRFARPPSEQEQGRIAATFRDPDGTEFLLVQR
ncbi:MAG: VOC family protein [Gaiellaceae bacterium]